MKILIIGKHGQIASALIDRFSKNKDFEVVAFGKDELDVRNIESVKVKVQLVKPDIIINTSAYLVVSNCEIFPNEAFALNSIAVRNLALTSKEIGARLVTISTDYVFDGNTKTPYHEYDCPNPLQIYGISKLAGEYAALNYHPLSWVIRTCALFGGVEGSVEKKGNFVLYIIKEAKNSQQLEVSMEQTTSPTYAVDLAEAIFVLIQNNPRGGIYHLINEGYCSWSEFAEEIIKTANLNLKIIPVDRGGEVGGIKRSKFSVLGNYEAKKIGIVLPKWQDGLKRYISFLKQHHVI